MFLFKLSILFVVSIMIQLVFAEGAWAWGPAVHTVIGCKILEEAGRLLPGIVGILQAYPLEFLYGSLAADFFVGKGQKQKIGHSHNWETGFKFLGEADGEREQAYAYGFFAHLAADVVAHNYYVPNLIQQNPAMKRLGHLYCEAKADYFVGSAYIKMAREILGIEDLQCDHMLKAVAGKRGNGLKTRRRIYTQSVKITDFLSGTQNLFFMNGNSRIPIPHEFLAFMIQLSYRLVGDILKNQTRSSCLAYDPIGSRNLYLAGRNGLLSKILNVPRPTFHFRVDQELLAL